MTKPSAIVIPGITITINPITPTTPRFPVPMFLEPSDQLYEDYDKAWDEVYLGLALSDRCLEVTVIVVDEQHTQLRWPQETWCDDRIINQEIVEWLEANCQRGYAVPSHGLDGRVEVVFRDSNTAMLFKLTFG